MTDTPDNLRDMLAALIYNTSDEYARKLMVRPDCPGASEVKGSGKPVCYVLADAILAAPGIAVVELPEPRWPNGSWHETWHVLIGGEPESVYVDGINTNNVEIVASGHLRIYADEARSLAAALLAAADKAEEGK